MRYGGLRHTDHGLRSHIATRTRTLASLLRRYAWMPAGLTLVTAIGAGLLRYPAAADGQPGEPPQTATLHHEADSLTPDPSSASSESANQNVQQNSAHVTVNGKTYDVPENGQIHDEQTKDDSHSSVDISNHSSQNQGISTNSNTTTLHISTKSSGGMKP